MIAHPAFMGKYPKDFGTDEEEINAHLVSAAPDLLSAANALISVYDEQSSVAQRIIVSGRSDRELREDGISALVNLRTAIAKAEGR